MKKKLQTARIGFIGAGWWATSNHIPILAERKDVDLVGVCRLGKEALLQVKNRFGFRYATEDFWDLLETCELDGVVVASPHTLHYEHARAALEKGLHVMCEKPLTTKAQEARTLVSLAEKQEAHLLVPYGWHYKPFVKQAKDLMDKGAIGEIEYLLCHMASPIRSLLSGKEVKVNEISGQSSDNLFQPDSATWADPDVSGGGYGYAQISHSTGMMFWLTGLCAQSVFSMMTGPGARVDLYNSIAVKFSSGAIGTVSGAGNVPEDCNFQVDIRIFGKEGMLLLDCERTRLELRRNNGQHLSEELAADAGFYECTGPGNNFIDLILGKSQENLSPGNIAMRSVELLDAAYRSSISEMSELV